MATVVDVPEEPDEENPNAVNLSDLARERRLRATESAAREKPTFVLDVQQSECMYTLGSRAIPLAQIDPVKLIREVEATYSARLDPVNWGPLLSRLAREELAALPHEEALRRLLQSRDVTLSFSGGRFPAKWDFVQIVQIRIDFESVLVRVAGVSQVAEVVAEEVLETIWRSAGVSKKWEDLKAHLQLATYATGTAIQLGFPFEQLLHPRMQSFLHDRVIEGPGYAAEMGSLSARHQFGRTPSIVATATIESLRLAIHRFDKQTGRSEEVYLTFMVRTRDEAGTGIVLVSSELSYDRHVAALADLIRALQL